MKIGLVTPVKPSHPYLEDDPAPLLDLHYLRISPWFRFRKEVSYVDTKNLGFVLDRRCGGRHTDLEIRPESPFWRGCSG